MYRTGQVLSRSPIASRHSQLRNLVTRSRIGRCGLTLSLCRCRSTAFKGPGILGTHFLRRGGTRNPCKGPCHFRIQFCRRRSCSARAKIAGFYGRTAGRFRARTYRRRGRAFTTNGAYRREGVEPARRRLRSLVARRFHNRRSGRRNRLVLGIVHLALASKIRDAAIHGFRHVEVESACFKHRLDIAIGIVHGLDATTSTCPKTGCNADRRKCYQKFLVHTKNLFYRKLHYYSQKG